MKLKLPSTRQRERKAKARDPRRLRKQRTVMLSVLTGLAIIATPIARPLGYSLADGLCSGEGCSTSVGQMPQCSGVGRDKALSSSLTSFSTTAPAQQPMHLAGVVNGAVKIATPAQHGEVDIYSFSDQEQAKRFVYDESTSLPRAIDAGVGPTTDGTYKGFTKLMAKIGLVSKDSAEPWAEGTRFAAGENSEGVISQNVRDQHTTQTLVTQLPVNDTPSMNRLAATLGITGVIKTDVRKAPDGTPYSLTISGPASEAWNLSVIKASQFNRATLDSTVKTDGGNFVVRSYTLDLKQTTNREAYKALVKQKIVQGAKVDTLKTGLFDKDVAEGKADRNPYAAMRERARDTGVVTETAFATSADLDVETQAEAFTKHALMHESTAGLEAREVNAADLALSHAKFEPFVSCEKES